MPASAGYSATPLLRKLGYAPGQRACPIAGLVDIKVCAVDATWSGLELATPRAARS